MTTPRRAWYITEALATATPATRARFALTTCNAAGRCQHDLGCPFLDDCHGREADLIRDWAQDDPGGLAADG